MAIQVTSQTVTVPQGLRMTAGFINYNGATYTVNGDSITAAQWGGGVNGIPNRVPDFVVFQGASRSDSNNLPSAATGFGTTVRYIPGSGKIQVFGEEALVADSGLTEQDAEASQVTVSFLAFWVEAAPQTVN